MGVKITKASAQSNKPTSSLPKRMHDGLEKKIKQKLFQSKISNCSIPQENWDNIDWTK